MALKNNVWPDLNGGLFADSGDSGLRAGGAQYEAVVDSLSSLMATYAPEGALNYRLPPVMRREELERSGYARSFPHLLGVVAPHPSAADAGAGDALVLTPAACYPVYPALARHGPAPSQGWMVDVRCDCFRCEASFDVARLRSFRMREFVFVGAPEDAQAFRDRHVEIGGEIAGRLGLPFDIAPANDPFFGPGSSFLKAQQRAERLKFELLIPIIVDAPPTACASFNHHHAHFGEIWGLTTATGACAHSACVAFGVDRLATALFAHHGPSAAAWPAAIRATLRLPA